MSRYRVVVLAPLVVYVDAFTHAAAGNAAREHVARSRGDIDPAYQPVVLALSEQMPAAPPAPRRA